MPALYRGGWGRQRSRTQRARPESPPSTAAMPTLPRLVPASTLSLSWLQASQRPGTTPVSLGAVAVADQARPPRRRSSSPPPLFGAVVGASRASSTLPGSLQLGCAGWSPTWMGCSRRRSLERTRCTSRHRRRCQRAATCEKTASRTPISPSCRWCRSNARRRSATARWITTTSRSPSRSGRLRRCASPRSASA